MREQAAKIGDDESERAALAVAARVEETGHDYFRLHPKGVGLICSRKGGLPQLTFVEEYFGELHAPWRWFEIQVRHFFIRVTMTLRQFV